MCHAYISMSPSWCVFLAWSWGVRERRGCSSASVCSGSQVNGNRCSTRLLRCGYITLGAFSWKVLKRKYNDDGVLVLLPHGKTSVILFVPAGIILIVGGRPADRTTVSDLGMSGKAGVLLVHPNTFCQSSAGQDHIFIFSNVLTR